MVLRRCLFSSLIVLACSCAKKEPARHDGATPPLNLNGDVTGPPNANVVAKIDGITLPSPSGVNTVPTYNIGAITWAPNVATPTGTGFSFQSSGVTNAASVTITGDVTEGALSGNNVPLTVTQMQGGAVTVGTQGQLTCASADTTCELTQASTTNATPAALLVTPQISTAGSNESGSMVEYSLSAPTGSGSPGYLDVSANSVSQFRAGQCPGALSSSCLWEGVTPNTNNFLLQGFAGSSVELNAPSSSGIIYHSFGNGAVSCEEKGVSSEVDYASGWNVSVNSTSPSYGGMVGGIALANATVPTSACSGGVCIYGESPNLLGINAGGISFPSFVSGPIYEQDALPSTSSSSGVTGSTTTVTAQTGQAATGASHNGGMGGTVEINAPAGGTSGSATAGATGTIQLEVAGATAVYLGGANGTGAGWQSNSLAISATGTTTPTPSQLAYPVLHGTGTLTGAVTLAMPNATGLWYVDLTAMSGVSGTNTITIKSGTGACSAITSVSGGVTGYFVVTNPGGSNTIVCK
jgi:hypothetical protein